ncbi:hypothetical protein BS78_01G078800 [Paspalum vaginatum]|nr:hypothetical protein BS78_01G078800 [Paspalum vaginatum]
MGQHVHAMVPKSLRYQKLSRQLLKLQIQPQANFINPDICIINYYNNVGKLGLHQDKDESRKSINQGLPVISVSIGDMAEFLFSDTRDKDRATKINLESGDILILGGRSRLLFHGISHVKPNTAPTWLKEETDLRPGRVNLTFRQY